MNGRASYTASAGPSSSSSAVGDHEQLSQSQVYKSHLPDGQHAAVVCDHLWQHGWQRGEYSDVEVRVRDRPYQLHRIILSKSPYMDYLLKVTPRGQPIWIPVPDDPLFEEAMAIVFGYLYASHVLSSINAANARSVLTVATAFGMNDLCTHAYDVCRQSITADTIQEWVEWIDLQEPKSDHSSASRASTPVSLPADVRHINGTGLVHPTVDRDRMDFGTAPSVEATATTQVYGNVQKPRGMTSPNGWKDVFSQPADNFVTQLKQDIYTYLTIQLPEDLREISPSSTLNNNRKFTEIFTRLPFDLFKACIEDPQLHLGTDQERFAFAKAMIQQRKRKTFSKAVSGRADAAYIVENVVLRFGGDVGTKVHITRKSKQRALWKVEKE